MRSPRALRKLVLPLAWLALNPAWAERPMAVDDAGTLPLGGTKIEFGWARDDEARGLEGALGHSPLDGLELELNYARAHDHAFDSRATARGVGFAAKWVPLQSDVGLSLGLKYAYGHEMFDAKHLPRERAFGNGLRGLASWRWESGQVVHLNIGREWARVRGDTAAVNTWGIGGEQPLLENLKLTLEAFGDSDSRPDRALGLRYEVFSGFKVSGALGRGNDHSFANTGVAWEF